MFFSPRLLKCDSEAELYQLSLVVEPRNKTQADANQVLDMFESMGLF